MRKLSYRSCTALAAALLVHGAAFAQSGQVSLSGVLDLAARHTRNSSGSMNSIVSGGNSTSRLVIRGNEDLGDGWRAGFWLEGAFNADTGSTASSTQFWDRRSTVSLAGPWGEVRMGRDWTPAFLAWATTDPFVVVGVGGAISLFSSGPSTAFSRAFGTGASTLSRSNNAFEYWLPPGLGGVYGQAMVAAGENGNAAGSFRYDGARLGYAAAGLDVAAFYGNTRRDIDGERFKQVGARGSYDLRFAKLMGSVVDSRFLDSKHRALILGLTVPVGVGEVKLSYVKVDQSGNNAAGASIDRNDANLFGLGYVHLLSKRTALYANAGHISNKGLATYTVPGGPAGIAAGSNSTGYEVGLRHAF